jgi:hypothetical protein
VHRLRHLGRSLELQPPGRTLAFADRIMDQPIKKQIEETLAELESVADEIRVKLHLAGMDANALWNEKLEPRLLDARKHAREAKDASKAAIDDTIAAFRGFHQKL